jgi:hypothetical protein
LQWAALVLSAGRYFRQNDFVCTVRQRARSVQHEGGKTMNRRSILSLSTIALLGLALLPGSAVGHQKTLKEQLVGTWTFVSAVDVHPDGRRTDPWGPNPKGVFMFDGTGRFAQFIIRSDLPKLAAGTRDKGTADENKAIMAGFVGNFGTYTVNETDKTVTTRVEGGAFPNLIGVDQKRIILSLTADELKYANPATSTGMTAESIWKRVK